MVSLSKGKFGWRTSDKLVVTHTAEMSDELARYNTPFSFYSTTGNTYTDDYTFPAVILPDPGADNQIWVRLYSSFKLEEHTHPWTVLRIKISEDGVYKTQFGYGSAAWDTHYGEFQSTPGSHIYSLELGFDTMNDAFNTAYIKDRYIKFFEKYNYFAVPK